MKHDLDNGGYVRSSRSIENSAHTDDNAIQADCIARLSKANSRFRSYPIDGAHCSRFPSFEVTQSGKEIKVK
jgi:hypothetical protein